MAYSERTSLLLCVLSGEYRLSAPSWSPPADVCHTPEGWLVKLELAGVSPGDITISTQGRRLTVSGVRRDCPETRPLSHQQMEIAYGAFERSVEFPVDLEEAAIATAYRDGMLLVAVTPGKGEGGR